MEGLEHLDKVVDIDQSPIGRTPRSNPATYTGLFTPIRELLSGTQEARSRGYQPGRFSFNVKGGRCEACQGMASSRWRCTSCRTSTCRATSAKGKALQPRDAGGEIQGQNIHEILEMTVEDAREFFDPVPAVARKLQTLMDVGLSYIRLGQSATTLSGGEAQRVKLARELSSRIPVRPSIFWTSRPPACTSTTSSSCSRYCTNCGDQGATPSSSSSTTWTSSKPRTGSLIWARKGRWWWPHPGDGYA